MLSRMNQLGEGQVAAKDLPVSTAGLNDILKRKKNVIIKCDAEGAAKDIPPRRRYSAGLLRL